MADFLDLTIVTPERSLVRDEVEAVQVPGLGGYLGLLPGHAPLFSELQIGVLVYTVNGMSSSLAIASGFLEVLDNEVRVLANVAERAAEIDIERANDAYSRAEERLAGSDDAIDVPRAISALERAKVRIQIATSKH